MQGEGMTKGETTRQKIIEQAAPLFNQLGFAGCSMQDIMAATGLEKGGIYRHFSSKEELAEAVFRYSLTRVSALRWEGIQEVEGALEKLRFMIRRFVQVQSIIPGGCPVMNTAIDSDDGNPALKKLVQNAVQEWKDKISGIVTMGIERGEIQPAIEPRSIANIMIAVLEGALMISRLEGNREAVHDAEAMLEKFVASLQPRARSRKAGRRV
jgi:AcrR family transcriptional regulator